MMDFAMFHLMLCTIRVQVTHNEHAPKYLVSHTLETSLPAGPRFSLDLVAGKPELTKSMITTFEKDSVSDVWRATLLVELIQGMGEV